MSPNYEKSCVGLTATKKFEHELTWSPSTAHGGVVSSLKAGQCLSVWSLHGFPVGAPVSTIIKNMYVRLISPVSALDQGAGSELSPGAAQWLPSAPNS